MFRLDGKNALITGASGGIGGEIAKALHAAGARVALSGTRVEPLQALADELGSRADVLPCNLSDAEAVTALPKQAADAMGSVDILVNNAGVTRDNLFMRMSDDEWTSVLDINLTSTMRLCKGVMRGMMKARWGRIINVSSIVGAKAIQGKPIMPPLKLALWPCRNHWPMRWPRGASLSIASRPVSSPLP